VDVSDRIAALVGPAAASAGLVVDGVEVSAAGSRSRVLVTLDLPEDAVGSASLDAIAKASRGIGELLDGAEVPKGPYVLEVSTPGIDRLLTERRHFLRARTRLVTLRMRDGSTAGGRLVDVVGDAVVLDAAAAGGPASRREIPFADVESGRVEVDFSRAADGDGDGGD